MAKIYIDPGHGGNDPGAVANGIKEKDVVLKIAKYTRKYLQENYNNVSVKMSRTGDTFPSLSARASDANKWGADVFVSIHINAGGGTGYEDYIYIKLSNSSNAGKLRDELHKKLSPHFSQNRGKKNANFAVLRQTKMPAVLTENGFIDNKADAEFLKSDRNLKKLGQDHAEGIAVYLGLSKGKSKTSGSSSGNTSKSISQMADEVIAGKHGSGHANRRESLGISQSEYEKVRDEVNKRAGASSKPSSPKKSVSQMAQEVINGKHGTGHDTRRKSLGISKAQYEKVRAEVNKRL